MNFFCIADSQTVRGFALAGIPGCVAATAGQAAAALEEAVARPDCGLLLLTESVAATIRQRVETLRLQGDRPLIAVIPGPEGPLPGRPSLRQLVQQAVGIRLG